MRTSASSFSSLISALFLSILLVVSGADGESSGRSVPAMSNRVIAQFLDRLPGYNPLRMQRRFDMQAYENEMTMRKRNNAEVVNHILKNFGNLDRLGDVGR